VIAHRWAGHLAPGIARGLASTWRLDVEGEDSVRGLADRGRSVVFAVWHGRLLAPLWHRRRQDITLLVSQHPDGRVLARAAQRWGYDVVTGSSTRGGSTGLRRVIGRVRGGAAAAFAADGPRGPARRAKPGVVAAARHAGAVLVPVGVHARSAWQARSWDTFLIPKPFADVRIVYGPPIDPEGDTATLCQRLEGALSDVEQRARC
jgi:lysophospholipid acyltransferase (LPLAT)-like uncharacterized protein